MSGFFKKTIQISLVLIAVFSTVNSVFAQESNTITLNTFPAYPRAGDSVTLTISSDSIDLNSAKIVWYIDGVARKSTTNQNVVVKISDTGETMVVRVVIETSDGVTKELSAQIVPSGIDLVIEPVAYTLPFYKGKPYIIGQGTVKVIAIPDVMVGGTKMSPKDLFFRWKRGETILDESGKGKDSVIITSNVPVRDIPIDVQVYDDSNNLLSETSKIIQLSDPAILFYENSSLYGILYNKAITGNYFLGTREELKVVAKPFSFSFTNDTISNAVYSWYINKQYIAPTGRSNELILKQTSTNIKGTASISINLKNSSKINQFTNGSFKVDFGE